MRRTIVGKQVLPWNDIVHSIEGRVPDILICNPNSDLIFKRKERRGKLIGRHHRERNASVFDFLWWYKLHKLDHSSHQSKSSVNVDRLTSNVSASVKHRYQFNFDFAVDESHQKRTSSTRLQSRQRRLHV